jgi:hypothetical protein
MKKPHIVGEMDIDPEVMENTRKAINRLVEEIVDLQSTLLLPDLYFRQFLARLLTCLAAPAGAIWQFSPGQGLKRIAVIGDNYLSPAATIRIPHLEMP